MKIALIGYGKMGKEVEKIALKRQHTIVPQDEADLWIDFSHPDGILERIDAAHSLKKPLVIGTTGWNELLEEAEKRTKSSQGSLFVSPNFSLGVNLFLAIVKQTYKTLERYAIYDVAGFELHHNQKKDSPSGTAKMLSEAIGGKEFASLRVGHVPGSHSVIFDSSCDTITLAHEARSREGFALGAVMAAEWLLPKKGFFTMHDMMEDYV